MNTRPIKSYYVVIHRDTHKLLDGTLHKEPADALIAAQFLGGFRAKEYVVRRADIPLDESNILPSLLPQ